MNRRQALWTLLQTIGGLTAGVFMARQARAASRAVAGNRSPAPDGLIDSYSHFSNLAILDFLENNGGPRPHVFRRLFTNTPTLIDAERRIALMDELGVTRSVLVPLPWLERRPAGVPLVTSQCWCPAGVLSVFRQCPAFVQLVSLWCAPPNLLLT